ncbi:MAG TPA: cell division protein FtsQ/DivIB [Fodinibius sp.]|nr:cell division protein FtsQ/DivIB [Fodinibius sp.]
MTKKEPHNKSATSKSGIHPLPWMAGAILVLGLAVMAGIYWSSMMKVQEIYFEGPQFVSEKKLREIDIPTGIHPDSLNTLDLIKAFERIPYVKQAAIEVEPGGNLTIQISERQPVAMLLDDQREMYIDGEGILLPMITGKAVNVPLLHGFDVSPAGDTLSGTHVKSVTAFLAQLQKKPVSDATISEVAWTENGIVALTNQHGVKLIFGKTHFADRLRNWEAFYAEIIKQKGIERMQMIDLRFQQQIVTHEKHGDK